MKCYRNITTDEVVYKEEAEEYVINRLGITVTEKGKNGEMTEEQLDFIESTVDWYFSGNWVEENIKEVDEDDDIPDLEYEIVRYENYHEAIFEGNYIGG